MNIKDFHVSTGQELLVIKNRVRNLVEHWGEDGRYKEAIFKSVLSRFLPKKYIIASGFVIKQSENEEQHLCSTQIDLLIYDTSYPVFFKEGDFVIVTPDAVKAIIEIKTKITDISKIIIKANKNGRFIYDGKKEKPDNFFNGIFSFEFSNNIKKLQQAFSKIVQSSAAFINDEHYTKYRVNHISFNEHYMYFTKQIVTPNSVKSFLVNCPDMSFSYFISLLIDYLGAESISENHKLWYVDDNSLDLIAASEQ